MDKNVEFSAHEVKFLTEIDAPNGAYPMSITVEAPHNYIRHLDQAAKEEFEKIYQKHINPKFVLCYHCGDEVLSTVRAVFRAYKKYQASEKKAEKAEATTTTTSEIPPVKLGTDESGKEITETVTTKPAAKKAAVKSAKKGK